MQSEPSCDVHGNYSSNLSKLVLVSFSLPTSLVPYSILFPASVPCPILLLALGPLPRLYQLFPKAHLFYFFVHLGLHSLTCANRNLVPGVDFCPLPNYFSRHVDSPTVTVNRHTLGTDLASRLDKTVD